MNSVRVTEGIRGPLGWLSVIAPKTDTMWVSGGGPWGCLSDGAPKMDTMWVRGGVRAHRDGYECWDP